MEVLKVQKGQIIAKKNDKVRRGLSFRSMHLLNWN